MGNKNDNQTITIAFTDSGLGGLSIFAEVYERLKLSNIAIRVDLIYCNALPETGKGYNRINDNSKKIEIFNNVLYGIEKHFKPDLISIACNTLSVLTNQTAFYKRNPHKVVGIVETGKKSLLSSVQKSMYAYVVIFGTETTIKSDVHRKLLLEEEYLNEYIVTQECPDLASEIEFDFQSKRTENIIEKCVLNVTEQIKNKKAKLFLYLACTHYGYVAEYFLTTFYTHGYLDCDIINPNQTMVEYILKYVENINTFNDLTEERKINIRVVSRCKLLPEEISSISNLVQPISQRTVTALQNYEWKEDLFNLSEFV